MEAKMKCSLHYYTIIKNKLNLAICQLKIASVKPKIKENRVLVNSVFKLMNVAFDPEGAKDLIFDCQNVSVNEMEDIEKGNRSNPKKRSDHLDHFRHYCNQFHKNNSGCERC
jgi:hypothetical protein